jgi:hypothetical protein
MMVHPFVDWLQATDAASLLDAAAAAFVTAQAENFS